ncbi:MAG: TIGR04013 family B12-binding domain/radical SAM domain-containing protein, partial [Candidatus Riflebacteria bacterium]|nr:TIGR04013 family B12-binding domain/radical SAM domain-containing protein [Candidatus Riflebacteria bacterium]
RKNPYSVAALVGALEVSQGETPAGVQTGGHSPVVPLSGWSIDFFDLEKLDRFLEDRFVGVTVLAFSFMSIDRPEVRAALDRIGRGARVAVEPTLIAGGAHPSGDPEGTLAMGFDHAFVGEAEITLPSFLAALASGREYPAIVRPPRPPPCMDHFPSFGPAHGLLAPIELSRGCPYSCKFCHVPFVQGRRMHHRSVESVREHVRIARARGRVRTWFVTSDAFAYGSRDGQQGDRDTIQRLLRTCKDEGMDEVFFGGFPSEVRPDHVQEELLELVASHCANRTIVIGAQSGSDEVLKRIARGHDAAAVMDAVRRVRSFGLVPHVDFMLGLPGETGTERVMTLDMIADITANHGGRVHVHYFMPHGGTPYADAIPEPVEDSVLAHVETLTGKNLADGYWRKQRLLAGQVNPRVVGA